MMLTPEQLANLRQAAKGGWKVELDGRGIREIVAHIDAQQARIAELEENAGAHALAMKAGKAMLQAETERADRSELLLQRWMAFGKAMHKAGSQLPRNLIAETDAAMQPTWPEDTSDYGSRIAVIGQNGATGEHYEEDSKQ